MYHYVFLSLSLSLSLYKYIHVFFLLKKKRSNQILCISPIIVQLGSDKIQLLISAGHPVDITLELCCLMQSDHDYSQLFASFDHREYSPAGEQGFETRPFFRPSPAIPSPRPIRENNILPGEGILFNESD